MRFDDVLARVRRGHDEPPHEWSGVGPWRGVPYIGPFFARRMEAGGFHNPTAFVGQVDAWLRLVPPAQRPERLLRIVQAACQDRRANQCTRRNSYHTRDYHPACFFALLAVLHVLWDVDVPAGRRRPLTRDQLAALATNVNWRREAAATCGCRHGRADCNAREGCVWQPAVPRGIVPRAGLLPQALGGRCVPSSPRADGFKSLPGFYGQKAKVPAKGLTLRPGTSYTRTGTVQWRAPGPVAVLAALGAPGVIGGKLAAWPA